jgi:hypothetical protein
MANFFVRTRHNAKFNLYIDLHLKSSLIQLQFICQEFKKKLFALVSSRENLLGGSA